MFAGISKLQWFGDAFMPVDSAECKQCAQVCSGEIVKHSLLLGSWWFIRMLCVLVEPHASFVLRPARYKNCPLNSLEAGHNQAMCCCGNGLCIGLGCSLIRLPSRRMRNLLRQQQVACLVVSTQCTQHPSVWC